VGELEGGGGGTAGEGRALISLLLPASETVLCVHYHVRPLWTISFNSRPRTSTAISFIHARASSTTRMWTGPGAAAYASTTDDVAIHLKLLDSYRCDIYRIMNSLRAAGPDGFQ
jgi:hypothetical protein